MEISNIRAETAPEGRLHAPTGIVMLGEKRGDTKHMIENVTIKGISVSLEGGGRVEEVGEILERRQNDYPEYIYFFPPEGKRLYPAYGVYARRIKGVTFEEVNITTRKPDTRPCVFLEDAHDVKVDIKTIDGNGPFMETKESSGIIGSDS